MKPSRAFLQTFLVVGAAACGGGGSDPQTTPAGTMAETPPPAEEPAPAGEPATVETPPPAEAPPPTPPAPQPKTLSEDLDGDGTPEEVSLLGSELKIGEVAVALDAGKLVGAPEALELKVVDVNGKDKARELVIVDRGGGDTTWWLISWDGKKKAAGAPSAVALGAAGEPTLKGDGKIVASHEVCGQTITTTWKLSKGKVGKPSEKKKGKHLDNCVPGAVGEPQPVP